MSTCPAFFSLVYSLSKIVICEMFNWIVCVLTALFWHSIEQAIVFNNELWELDMLDAYMCTKEVYFMGSKLRICRLFYGFEFVFKFLMIYVYHLSSTPLLFRVRVILLIIDFVKTNLDEETLWAANKEGSWPASHKVLQLACCLSSLSGLPIYYSRQSGSCCFYIMLMVCEACWFAHEVSLHTLDCNF